MSYHHCPIEPPDWSYGPDCEGDCSTCEGTGFTINDFDVEVDCSDCQGTGFREPEYFDDDVL